MRDSWIWLCISNKEWKWRNANLKNFNSMRLLILLLIVRTLLNPLNLEVLLTHDIPREDSPMKRSLMLIVSLRGTNQAFWSQLACSELSTCLLGCTQRYNSKRNVLNSVFKSTIYHRLLSWIVVDNEPILLNWYLLGDKKAWATPRLVSLRNWIQIFQQARCILTFHTGVPLYLPFRHNIQSVFLYPVSRGHFDLPWKEDQRDLFLQGSILVDPLITWESSHRSFTPFWFLFSKTFRDHVDLWAL